LCFLSLTSLKKETSINLAASILVISLFINDSIISLMLTGSIFLGLPNLTPFSLKILMSYIWRSLILFLSFSTTNDNAYRTILLMNLPTRFFPSILVLSSGIRKNLPE